MWVNSMNFYLSISQQDGYIPKIQKKRMSLFNLVYMRKLPILKLRKGDRGFESRLRSIVHSILRDHFHGLHNRTKTRLGSIVLTIPSHTIGQRKTIQSSLI